MKHSEAGGILRGQARVTGHHRWQVSLQPLPTLAQCWSNVRDVGPALSPRWTIHTIGCDACCARNPFTDYVLQFGDECFMAVTHFPCHTVTLSYCIQSHVMHERFHTAWIHHDQWEGGSRIAQWASIRSSDLLMNWQCVFRYRRVFVPQFMWKLYPGWRSRALHHVLDLVWWPGLKISRKMFLFFICVWNDTRQSAGWFCNIIFLLIQLQRLKLDNCAKEQR